MKVRMRKERGFTLVEMAMVVSVIGLIATTMALTVRQAMQAKIADATKQLANAGMSGAGGGGTGIALGGMKFYEPATSNSSIVTSQNESTSSGYNKGTTNYTSNLAVSRSGSEATADPKNASDDADWLKTKW